ncbi:ABC transporter ATP-binding protein [Alicyclobacillus pomorum]|uniref:ABC transporter ATP-binding protein n=1 Tax=Alicyclobacillus pomorum TaxID=204470 RepID=UPI00047DECD7|nr:betaine/proline/choline family ABC transporter ATP-binding protein [Alicyclobacillus pomorum]
MESCAVQFQNVSKTYGRHRVVTDLTLAIPAGRLVTVIGPSGCGKTTTLKMINRLIEPSSGIIYVEGQDVRKRNPVELRRSIGYVIQQIGLFPHMTIEENISLVARLNHQDKGKTQRRAEELLDLIGLDPAKFRHRYPRELSGGQQQRVGVARALAADPSIVLMDEPFSALDPINRESLQDELIRLQATLQKTIIFVTHDMDEAIKISDQIVIMKDGEMVQADSPDQILRHPKNDFVREFVGEKRFQQAAWAAVASDAMTNAVTVSANRGLAEAVRLMGRYRVNGLIVTDAHHRYLGAIGTVEICKHYGNEHKTVADVMNRSIPVVSADTPMKTVLDLMETDGRGYIPVLDREERLLGVITRASLIRLVAETYKGGVDVEYADAGLVSELG